MMINKVSFSLLELVAFLSRVQGQSGLAPGSCFCIDAGRQFDLLNVCPDLIEIKDIAKGLAYKPRFCGFSPHFYSLAEHSLLMERLAGNFNETDYCARLEALLFNAAEAYTGGLVAPLERISPNYLFVKRRVQDAIYKKFGVVPGGYSQKVAVLDQRASEIERRVFYEPADLDKRFVYERYIQYLQPDAAMEFFLSRFVWLTGKICCENGGL